MAKLVIQYQMDFSLYRSKNIKKELFPKLKYTKFYSKSKISQSKKYFKLFKPAQNNHEKKGCFRNEINC